MGKAFLIALLFVGIAFISQNVSAKEPKSGVNARTFTYLNEQNWGNLDPSYKECSAGTNQSPIHIVKKQAELNKDLSSLLIDYQITNATIMTNGLIPQLSVKGKTEMTVDGKVYRLLNLRWHVPAEHVIDGVTERAEMQQMFAATDGSDGIVIVATLYKLGGPDPIIHSISDEMHNVSHMMEGGKGFGLAKQVSNSFSKDCFATIPMKKYFKYMGSLTTPPCTEQVIWFVVSEPQTMTPGQSNLINALKHKENLNNARPVKPLNGRVVEVTA